MAFADDLMEMYPDAKVILNERNSAAAWHTSITGTLKFFSTTPYLLMCYLWATDYWHWKVLQAAKALWNRRHNLAGTPDDALGPMGIFVIGTFDRHNSWVREAAKKNGNPMVEWQPQQGWEPICTFLEKPVPHKPFPRLNDEHAIKVLTMILPARGLLSWAALLASPAVAYWAWARFIKM